jgi:nicotinic acid mononucleotide adenylyltransferase
MSQRVNSYLHSFFTWLGILMGLVMYVSYALPTGQWTNPQLVTLSVVTGLFLPGFTTLSDTFEYGAIQYWGSLFLGKFVRFLWQSTFNSFALSMLVSGGIVDIAALRPVGGAVGAVTLMSFASQGIQYLMIELVNRNIGNRYLNIILALSLNICVAALAALGFRPVQTFFVLSGLCLGFIGAGYSLISDLLGLLAPRGGVGLFFGTFNPVHRSHLKILSEFIRRRGLEKVYLHSTVVPNFYQGLLDEGLIEIEAIRDGMRVYRKTGRGNLHLDYFPTGRAFFEVENRLAMLRAAVEDAGLEDKVEVLYLPETYQSKGFRGIAKYVRAIERGKRLHGLHGSDKHGVIVRMIYDSAFVLPYTAVRKDKVSATAIRSGAKGMTTPTVERILTVLKDTYPKQDGDFFTFGRHHYVFRDNRLYPAGTGTWFGNPERAPVAVGPDRARARPHESCLR